MNRCLCSLLCAPARRHNIIWRWRNPVNGAARQQSACWWLCLLEHRTKKLMVLMRLWYIPAVGCDGVWSHAQTHTVRRRARGHTLVLYFCGISVSLHAPPIPSPQCYPPYTLSFVRSSFGELPKHRIPIPLFLCWGLSLSTLPTPTPGPLVTQTPLRCRTSPIMVVPPARAAFEPWVKSSTVVVPRYGIWKWVWMSMPPGITILPWASMVFTPPGTIRLSPICLLRADVW